MTKFQPFCVGMLCVVLLLSPRLVSVRGDEFLPDHVCVVQEFYKTLGSVSCNNSATGPLAPCVGAIDEYPNDWQCVIDPELITFGCTKKMLTYTRTYPTSTTTPALAAACWSIPLACVGCGLAAIVAGVATSGGTITITTAICSVAGCAGWSFLGGTPCCYTTCTPDPTTKVVLVWHEGC
jgi:hypothetical protein